APLRHLRVVDGRTCRRPSRFPPGQRHGALPARPANSRSVGAQTARGDARRKDRGSPALTPHKSPRCAARATACARLSAPNLRKIELTWNFTVRSVIDRLAEI